MSILDNKTILITGGTGSFGQAFTKFILSEHQPKAVRIFSRDELKQFEMSQVFPDKRLRFFVGDVRDKNRLKWAMENVDIVVHAAALKQVPSCEYNPFEAVKTNILGTQNVLESAIEASVAQAILVSTDKAVNPINLYGATKLCAEKIFVQGNVFAANKKTKASVVRYGNVIASRGSVIPLFKEQKLSGLLTITDPRMTRFWITQNQAVRFVVYCLAKMQGGEIFVPKLPSMRLIDLARAIAPEAKIKITGIRPGEKLHEVLLTSNEARQSKEFEHYFVVEPPFDFWRVNPQAGNVLKDDFDYRSDNNSRWLTIEKLRQLLNKI